jgi:hypothetical protein
MSSVTELFHISKPNIPTGKRNSPGITDPQHIPELFLQHLENIHIKQLIDSKNIILYTHYIDDLLIIYDTTRTTPDFINTYINQVHTYIQLNPTYENNNCIASLTYS